MKPESFLNITNRLNNATNTTSGNIPEESGAWQTYEQVIYILLNLYLLIFILSCCGEGKSVYRAIATKISQCGDEGKNVYRAIATKISQCGDEAKNVYHAAATKISQCRDALANLKKPTPLNLNSLEEGQPLLSRVGDDYDSDDEMTPGVI